MKPGPGMALAQVDVGTEEPGIAAACSGDPKLKADYLSGDLYCQFAKEALGIQSPTKQQRQIYKATVLGRIYGLGATSLARNLGISKSQADSIMDEMRARYCVLNAWLERVTTEAAHAVPITSVLGWSLTATGRRGEERTFLNFLMQAGGGELMRLVIVRAGWAGLRLIGCAHDSWFIEDTIDNIEQSVAQLQDIVRTATRDLFGFELRADCKPEIDIVRYPNRFVDERELEDGMRHWNWLMALIEEGDDDGSTDRRHGDAVTAAA
jgi:DNA polymerase-1